MSSGKLNGSTARLAEALRDVVREGVEEAVQPLENRLNARIDQTGGAILDVEERLNTRIDRAVEDIVAEKQSERIS